MASDLIFELTVCLGFEDRHYPQEVDFVPLGFFDSTELAHAYIKNCVATRSLNGSKSERDDEYVFLYFKVVAFRKNESFYIDHLLVFDSAGDYYGFSHNCATDVIPFNGCLKEDARFARGDFVEFALSHNPPTLHVGIIATPPPLPEEVVDWRNRGCNPDQSDNAYLVLHSEIMGVHEHIPECLLFEPRYKIDDAVRKRLHERLDGVPIGSHEIPFTPRGDT